MKLKSLISSLVTCLILFTLSSPALASSNFSDVQDTVTATNVDVLQLLGAVSGSGSDRFSPNANLTRAEFCVMAINVMGKADQVSLYTTRTIFQDVTARHWARGFVNLAASTTIGGTDNNAASRLISGVGNGNFQPDAPITYAQAVTILMRMLGYSDTQAGTVWPAGYLNLAKSISLTDGLSLSPNVPITRAQTAQLFVNLLSTKTSSGSPYYSTLGSAKKDVILLALNVEADDKTPGAIRTSEGTFLPAKEGVIPSSLLGKRGTLLLNDRSQIITFLPDNSTNTVITLSSNAKVNGLTASNGTYYSISPSTPAYTGSTVATYGDIWLDLYSGTQVTLFQDSGKVIGIFFSRTSTALGNTMVLRGNPSHAAFSSITGGIENYTITRNHQIIPMSDIKPYDVVTYDSVQNTLIVSDLRLTCVYESVKPSTASPTTIHALGYDFPVLECALDTIHDFTAGNVVTMLLTADGCVAELVSPSPAVTSTAIGFSSESSVELFLPAGGTIKLNSSRPLLSSAQNQIVSFSSTTAGTISAAPISNRSPSGDFDLIRMTLGNYTVTAGVSIFEKVNGGTVVPVSPSELNASIIPANKIAAYHLNGSNMVDVLVLSPFTGNSYEYGRYTEAVEEHISTVTGEPYKESIPYFETSSGGKIKLLNTINAKHGNFVGVVFADNSANEKRVISYQTLSKITGVSRSDFLLSNGKYYINSNNITYLVADTLQVYNQTTKQWFSGKDAVASVRAHFDDLTVYVDPIGQQIRIITVK